MPKKNTIGYVVVSDDIDFHKAMLQRSLFESHIGLRNFDRARIRYVRRPGLGQFGVEFWTVPSDASAPFEYTNGWNYGLPENTKPFIVYSGGFNESECLFPSGADILLDYMKSNPGSRGNVVVHSNGLRQFREIKENLDSEIRGTDPSAVNRVRYFYVPIKSIYFTTEFWILP